MRTPASLLLASTIGLAASIHVSAANAGGLYVGVGVPIVVTAPVIAEVPVTPPVVAPAPVAVEPAVAGPVVAPIAVEYDPTVVVGPDYYCCGPGWYGYPWRGYGRHGYGERGYVHPGYGHSARAEYSHPVAHNRRR